MGRTRRRYVPEISTRVALALARVSSNLRCQRARLARASPPSPLPGKKTTSAVG
jgi:hypothetical protein